MKEPTWLELAIGNNSYYVLMLAVLLIAAFDLGMIVAWIWLNIS